MRLLPPSFTYDWSVWLLLLIIPALILTLWPYFRLNKKYRRTRNRVISIILHMLIMAMCICVLSGIVFHYEVPNKESELILLVDTSFSSEDVREQQDEFIQSVVDETYSNFKVGIVTFGYDQVYASPLTNNREEIMQNYLSAELPDTSATNITDALLYAQGLFTNPATSKIVLLSDGLETDKEAVNMISTLSGTGIKIDTVCFTNEADSSEREVQIVGVTPPDYSIVVGVEFKLVVTVQTNFEGNVTVRMTDNDGEGSAETTVSVLRGLQDIELSYTFNHGGGHELRFEVSSANDSLPNNNIYYSYIHLEEFDDVLIIERTENESEQLRSVLTSVKSELNISRVTVSDAAKMPKSVDELRKYDEVILMNISNEDLELNSGFDEILYSYVYEFGGGVLTIGGNKDERDSDGNPVANTYNREDMYGTLYQELLPVQAINYTPPVGVVIIIDRSGSMNQIVGSETKLGLAKQGAYSCLNALSDRDYCGIMTLDNFYQENLNIIPCTQVDKIRAAIDSIEESDGGTVYTGAIDRAGRSLAALVGVERRHIILVTDGAPGDEYEEYVEKIKNNYEQSGITFSVVAIGIQAYFIDEMQRSAEVGHGRFHNVQNMSEIPQRMREDLNVPEIKAVNYEPFQPQIRDRNSVVSGIDQEDIPELEGFYGTKLKNGATVPLMGEYVPIFAQWKVGQGMVGSFMCDLEGIWSSEFTSDLTGMRLVGNMVEALFPTENIKPSNIDVNLNIQNYQNVLSATYDQNFLRERELTRDTITAELQIEGPDLRYYKEDGVTPNDPIPLTIEGNFSSRYSFDTLQPGLYTFTITLKDLDGNILDQKVVYRTFSYSDEYNMFTDSAVGTELMQRLATRGGGAAIQEAWQAFEGFRNTLQYSWDPMIPFIIASIVLFLLDIAVRKFKFKWPHEIIRDRREKKMMMSRASR